MPDPTARPTAHQSPAAVGVPFPNTVTGPSVSSGVPAPIEVPVEYGVGEHELVTADLLLRPLREVDRGPCLEALRSARPSLDETMPLHEPGWLDEDVFERQLAWSLEGITRGTAVRRAVLDRGTGLLLGMCNLMKIERGLSSRAEISVWLRPEATGRGLATEAVTAVVDDAFEDLPRGQGLFELSAWVRPHNSSSLRILEKLRFTRTSDAPQPMNIGGTWETHVQWMQTVDRWAVYREGLDQPRSESSPSLSGGPASAASAPASTGSSGRPSVGSSASVPD